MIPQMTLMGHNWHYGAFASLVDCWMIRSQGIPWLYHPMMQSSQPQQWCNLHCCDGMGLLGGAMGKLLGKHLGGIGGSISQGKVKMEVTFTGEQPARG